MKQDELLQEVMKDGQVQRERIDANVELFLEAAQKGDVKKLKQMLESNKSMIEQHDANKRTALHFAAHSNNVEELKLLLNNGADANATDWEGMPPLMYALRGSSTECAKLLLAIPDLKLSAVSEKGVTLVHAAVMAGDKDLAKVLVEKGASIMPHAQSESGSVLHFAATDSNLDMASFLVKHEPKLVNAKDGHQMTPLHLACAYNNEPMALFLIDHGADVNTPATDGTTPLHIAADCGNKAIVERMIAHGAVQRLDSTGHTPIMAAIKNKTKDIEDLLSKVTIDTEQQATTSTTAPKISPDQLKENGNKAFAEKEYEMAIHWYSLALDVESILCETFHRKSSLEHILYSNRSASYYHEKKYKEALADANKAVELAPDWPKGYLRKGHALVGLGNVAESEAAFAKMKELEAK